MRASPSGRRVPNEILRYSFPLLGPEAGATVVPLWGSPLGGVIGAPSVALAGPVIVAGAWLARPGSLGLASLTVSSGGGNTGSPIALQWLLATTLAPAPVGAPVPDFIAPTQPAGVTSKQLDFSDIIIPDTGAGLLPALIVPANLVIGGGLWIYFGVDVFWKDSTLRDPLG